MRTFKAAFIMAMLFSLLSVAALLLTSCGRTEADSPDHFSTTRLNMEMLRLENDEAVCYRWDKGGLACQWK